MCLQGTHLRGFQDQVDARVGKGAVKLAWGWDEGGGGANPWGYTIEAQGRG